MIKHIKAQTQIKYSFIIIYYVHIHICGMRHSNDLITSTNLKLNTVLSTFVRPKRDKGIWASERMLCNKSK